MPFALFFLLIPALGGDETMESLLQKLRADDPDVRTAAGQDLLAAWPRWKAEDLEKLEEAARDADPELSGRAAELRSRIRIRRTMGQNLFDRIAKADDAFYSGDDAAKVVVLGEAKTIWKAGKIGKEDLGGLESLAMHARWTDPKALDRFLSGPEARQTFSIPPDAESRMRVRIKEVESLGSEGKKRSLQVAEFLRDSAPEVRTTALRVMGGLQSREQAPSVAALLKDKHDGVRGEALALLGSWDAKEYASDFMLLLEDSSGQVRRRATEALGTWGQKDAGPRIARLFKDPFAPTRAEAAAAVGAFGAREFAAELAPLLADPQAMVRRNAAYAFGKFGDSRYAGRLKDLLQDRDPEVRLAAALSLGQLGSTFQADGILPLLRDADPDVRDEAAWVLGFAASKESMRHLALLLEDPDVELRHGAVQALGRLRARDFRAAVSALLEDPSAWVRSEAILSLARIGGPEDAPAIAAKLRDPDRKVRVSAAVALGELGVGDPQGALADLERNDDRLLGLSSTFSLTRLEKIGPAAQRQAIGEVAADRLAFACLGTFASDVESFVHGREAWDILERPLKLQRSIESWKDLSAALSDAGLVLEVETDCLLGRLDKSQSLSGRDALAWLLGPYFTPAVVLDGRKVRLMDRRDAVAFWKSRLERK
ncbi:MAG TPA: HEAT repeat domain-containing protein [Planctomycetota bacterium]|nr:HEAT repeat domain-containing protein [Planctomycetota bacterium]